eukprot:15357014-Ditylum_brightwellii.AAC.1
MSCRDSVAFDMGKKKKSRAAKSPAKKISNDSGLQLVGISTIETSKEEKMVGNVRWKEDSSKGRIIIFLEKYKNIELPVGHYVAAMSHTF